ncbi:unnamed protein product [Periconia digitata]|uniref:Uncharacterized protein n=1 Tax=Periconia digitata TaxID=1303443 RepID=A0A9W4UAF4_9PLEO|nr:unnamed protein product [Periconia digitata]
MLIPLPVQPNLTYIYMSEEGCAPEFSSLKSQSDTVEKSWSGSHLSRQQSTFACVYKGTEDLVDHFSGSDRPSFAPDFRYFRRLPPLPSCG